MLAQHGDHTISRQHLPAATAPWPPAWGDPAAWQTALAWCAAADFDPLRPILATASHPTPGPPAH